MNEVWGVGLVHDSTFVWSRVFSPTPKQDGQGCSSSVIEISPRLAGGNVQGRITETGWNSLSTLFKIIKILIGINITRAPDVAS